MRRGWFAAFAIAALFPCASPAQMTTLEGASRWGDLAKLVEGRLKGGAPANATLLGHLCLAYAKLKNYAGFFDCVGKLEARIAQGDDVIKGDYFVSSSIQAVPLKTLLLAEVYLELGQYDKSIPNSLKVLEMAERGSNWSTSTWPPLKLKLSALPLLVIASALSGDMEKAKAFTALLDNTPIPFVGGAMTRPIKENGLARAYMAIGSHEKALEHLGSSGLGGFAMGIADLVNGFSMRGDSIATYTELPRLLMRGKALGETGKRDDAKILLDGVLAGQRIRDAGDLHWLAAYERGRIAEKEGNAADAVGFYRRAIEVIEQQRATLNTEATKIGFAADKQAVYGRIVVALVAQKRVAEAFDYVERSKSRALVDLLASKKDFAVQARDPEAMRRALATLDSADYGSRIQEVAADAPAGSATRSLAVVRGEIRAAAPELATLVSVSSVPPEELRALLREDESLVEYYYSGSDLFAFVATRDKLEVVALEGKDLDAAVRGLREAIEQPFSEAWKGHSSALYTRLWKPLEAAVQGRKAVVVPHGVLHYLPFGALAATETSLLNDRHSLRLLPAASLLRFLRPPMAGKAAGLLALGNPDLGDPKMDLRHAGEEALALGRMFQDSRVLMRLDASETNFRRAGKAFPRLHFATHGKFNADEPLASGLFLAKDAENDGLLTVGELYSMTLDADLVTLSACETGLGKIASGDDVVGLTRGFLYAGSRSIVASLWSVDDRATALLMGAFYDNLQRMPKDEALRHAQLKVRETLAHPFFWAAFQLTGRAD